jgi:hypothetical protein
MHMTAEGKQAGALLQGTRPARFTCGVRNDVYSAWAALRRCGMHRVRPKACEGQLHRVKLLDAKKMLA